MKALCSCWQDFCTVHKCIELIGKLFLCPSPSFVSPPSSSMNVFFALARVRELLSLSANLLPSFFSSIIDTKYYFHERKKKNKS